MTKKEIKKFIEDATKLLIPVIESGCKIHNEKVDALAKKVKKYPDQVMVEGLSSMFAFNEANKVVASFISAALVLWGVKESEMDEYVDYGNLLLNKLIKGDK